MVWKMRCWLSSAELSRALRLRSSDCGVLCCHKGLSALALRWAVLGWRAR